MRLNKKAILLMIQILLVTLALVLTVATYAWYTANVNVEVSRTTVTSAAGANTEILMESSPVYDTYMGQKGTDDGDDAPYTAEKTLQVLFTPLHEGSSVQINLTSVVITKARGGTDDSSLDDTVIPAFTWRMTYNGHVYQPDENGFAYYMDSDERVYIDVDAATTLTIAFTLVYLDETSYQHYLAEEYEDITAFAYSGYEYMRANFAIVFAVGVDVRSGGGES